ncbi:MAG TPA: glycosyltransferase [Isosphaeraceae bacterium]|nr:glycosyltransferase [Isosphaeraceae bacterium]
MNPLERPELTSIIVPCWNEREFTRLCLRALFRHTQPAWELIVVDNGSTDGTGDFLAGVQEAAPVPVTLIRNPQNAGFPRAINQGLEVARGEYLVLLNNDAVLTDGWLDQLIALTRASTADPPLLTIVDYLAETAEALASPPLTPPSQGGERDGLDPPSQGGQRDGLDSHDPGSERRECGRPQPGRGIGLVGPMSNYATPPQLVEAVPYRDLADMEQFARGWRDQHRGKWFTVAKLSGFCLLMTRAVYDTIGGLDPRFSLGLFDDDDLAVRARRAGFELAVAFDLFIHHFGSRTFQGNGVDAETLLEENHRRFAAKWGLPEAGGNRVALRPWGPGAPPLGTRADRERNGRFQIPDAKISEWKGDRPEITPAKNGQSQIPDSKMSEWSEDRLRSRAKVSLTVIARDEQENLPRCLESVRGVFDEVVVVDTGSVDRTVEIAREFGARVFDFVWVDDFAAARNAALARARGEYAFWLDADDVVDPPEREKLQALIERLRPGEATAYVVRCACDPGSDGSGGQTVVDHVRLFPLREEVRWTYRVHEQILPALKRAGIPVQWSDVIVRHTGYTDPALRARKLVRDLRILHEEREDRPDDPFVLFNLGAIAIERQEWPEALGFLTRSLALSAATDSITRKLYALLARAHEMMGQPQRALAACAAGLALDPADAELLFREAVVRRRGGDSAGAEACWRRILTLTRPEQFASVDQGIYGHLTRRNLARLAAERGDPAEAARLWAEVLAECPGDREATAMLERSRPGGSSP